MRATKLINIIFNLINENNKLYVYARARRIYV